MADGPSASDHLVRGIQFKVLAHAFPVLRHDAIKPISNAKLATAMMAQKSARPSATANERSRALLADVDLLLDEGVEAFRSLDAWLRDDGGRIGLDQAIGESRKLVFTHLLLSGKRIRVDGMPEPVQVARFPARYVLLAWLLHAVDTMPAGSELALASPQPGVVEGRARAPAQPVPQDDASAAAAPVHWQEVKDLAGFHGWQVSCDGNTWQARAPAA